MDMCNDFRELYAWKPTWGLALHCNCWMAECCKHARPVYDQPRENRADFMSSVRKKQNGVCILTWCIARGGGGRGISCCMGGPCMRCEPPIGPCGPCLCPCITMAGGMGSPAILAPGICMPA